MSEDYIKSAKIFGYTGNLTGTVVNISNASFLHGIYNAGNIGSLTVRVNDSPIFISAGRVEFNAPLVFNNFSGSSSYTLIYS
jgi:hypothetical protein